MLNGPLCIHFNIRSRIEGKAISNQVFYSFYWPKCKEWIQDKVCVLKKFYVITYRCLLIIEHEDNEANRNIF
jgi:hypothetical protein